LIGNSILPRIFGPSNFSALIFSIVGPASAAGSCTGAAAGAGVSTFVAGVATTAAGLAVSSTGAGAGASVF